MGGAGHQSEILTPKVATVSSTECKGVGRSEWVFGKQVGFAHSLTRDLQGVDF